MTVLQDAARAAATDLAELKQRGLGLAAISYDSPAILKTFATQRGITFPLLSDTGSETIRRYEILNARASGKVAGIPYPGTFVLDRRGVVVSRSFEERYEERVSVSSLVSQTAGSGRSGPTGRAETAHMVVTTSASDTSAAPGTRISVFVDIAPKPKMHVYAPQEKDAIPVSLALEADRPSRRALRSFLTRRGTTLRRWT